MKINIRISTITFLLLILQAVSCTLLKSNKSDQQTIPNPQRLLLKSIKCLNLAEKMAGLGSKDDEILIVVLKSENENYTIAWHSEFLKFNAEDQTQELKVPIALDTNRVGYTYSITLIEYDTERSAKEIANLLETHINTTINLEALRALLREDDLHGLSALQKDH